MNDSYSSDLQSKLEALRSVYERAKARVNGVDPEWELRKDRLTQEVYTAVKRFQPEDPATKAVFIVASIQDKIKELDAPRLVVSDYETKRTRYAQLCASEGKPAVQF